MTRARSGVRIGSGAGFSGDRLEPAVILAEQGDIDYLALECLAERTIALAQLRERREPGEGYDPLMKRRIEMLLPVIKRKGIRLISNFGAANPLAAADAIIAIAKRQGLPVKVAVVTGDDVLDRIAPDRIALETGGPLSEFGELVSANAYLGADALLPALATGADIIVTGRVADPSLFVAPIAHHFGWSTSDLDRIARATVVGHLLECAAQICGGYFADPGVKDVTDLANVGFPFADVDEDGNADLGKVDGTGGLISLATVKEQLLYEASDPGAYITPDVTADFRNVSLTQVAPNRVAVSGARARGKSPTLKVSIGYLAGFVGEGEMSYAGRNALARARLAGDIIRERLKDVFSELRIDLIGSTSSHGRSFDPQENPYEIRLRVAARAPTAERAAIIGEEVEALYLNGPAGGGGARKLVTEQVGIVSTLIDRSEVMPQVTMKEWTHESATV
jgi:acyclic terpene utilization AtuA family protein